MKSPKNPPGLPRNDPIQCHDCHKLGSVVLPEYPKYYLPKGWKMVWCGLRRYYICGECLEKRRAFGMALLGGDP